MHWYALTYWTVLFMQLLVIMCLCKLEGLVTVRARVGVTIIYIMITIAFWRNLWQGYKDDDQSAHPHRAPVMMQASGKPLTAATYCCATGTDCQQRAHPGQSEQGYFHALDKEGELLLVCNWVFKTQIVNSLIQVCDKSVAVSCGNALSGSCSCMLTLSIKIVI